MSDSEEDSASSGRQKSIFSSMGRVKQINHLREKWSPKPKTPLPDRPQILTDTPPTSPWGRRPSRTDKFALESNEDSGLRSPRRGQSMSRSPRRQPVVTVVDMERYLAINSWLEHNGINVAQVTNSETEQREKSSDYGLFDDMYSSLEVLENSLTSELSHLRYLDHYIGGTSSKETGGLRQFTSSPALFDYLAVIGPDILDVKIRNFWNQRENLFEATVAFAHPPESQFNAESLEHFCFPTGIKSSFASASGDQRNEPPDEEFRASISKEGEFFVLMISGGGVQGQSVQYAMCMKGIITIRGGCDDGKNLVLPICYCIIAQIPLIPFFRAVLQGFLDDLRTEFESNTSVGCKSLSCIVTDKHASYIDDILQNLKQIPLPDKGLSISVDVFPPPSLELVLTRPHKDNDTDEKVALLLQWALLSLLSRLSIDRLLQIVSLLLVEMKLIVVSDEIPLLSSATLGLASLLHPLTWAGPLISVLPLSMHEYMEAPVPLICGVDELPRDFECLKGTCVLYLMENRVQLHPDDESAFEKLRMPGLESLCCDLTRFTKQMLGRVASSFRDKITPLSTHLVIHRIHRHIEQLISVCSRFNEHHGWQDAEEPLDADEMRFVDLLMQTQMYQKYQDDQPVATLAEHTNQPMSTAQTTLVPDSNQELTKVSTTSTQHDGLKSAASILFQIALAGVSTLPRSSSRSNIVAEICATTATDAQSHDASDLPIWDEPESRPVRLSLATSASPDRIISIMKNSPNEKPESPDELLSATLSESSIYSERRPDRTFVWPLSQSDLDVFWATDEASVASPGTTHSLALQSPVSGAFESPRRSPNNESEISYREDPKSVGRSEHSSLVNAQRADTETTISIFDTAQSEALGSADTADDSWLFELSDDQRPTSQQDDESDEDPFLKSESSIEEGGASIRQEEVTKDAWPEQNHLALNHRRQCHQDTDSHDCGETEIRLLLDIKLAPEQVDVLTAGISVDSRGAWEGWCEGKLFVCPDFSTLTWERRAAAFAALNMSIKDITGMMLDDVQGIGAGTQRVQLSFSREVISFQFKSASHHEEFFSALQLLLPDSDVDTRHRPFPPLSPRLLVEPLSKQHSKEVPDNHDEDKSTEVLLVPASPIQKESDIDQFKRKLQLGFLVEKHGRFGKPHTKLLFTDALCSHLMWTKPPTAALPTVSHNKSIALDSITAIVRGKQTAVFRRAASSKASDRVCFSILTPTRSLDICAYSLQGFQELYLGFSLLLEQLKD